MMSHPTCHRPRRAFTLIELLTVIAIIGILAAILIPVVGRVRESAHVAKTTSNLRQLFTANKLHAGDHKGLFVPHTASTLAGWGTTPAQWYNNPIFATYVTGANRMDGWNNKELVLQTGKPNANGGGGGPTIAVSLAANAFPRNICFSESEVDRVAPFMVMFADATNHYLSGEGTEAAPTPWPDDRTEGGGLAFRYGSKATAVLASGAVVRLTKEEATSGDNLRRYFPSTGDTGSATRLRRMAPPY